MLSRCAHSGFLFADTVSGAHASANLYSLVQSARANGVDSRNRHVNQEPTRSYFPLEDA